ncbi:hypothetical protein RJI07_01670 [Mycoplasmatota bacterium WC30]
MRRKQRETEMISEINNVLKEINAKVISFKKYYKVFGNMIVEIKTAEEIHVFVTDKGEINHNQELVYDNSYHESGKNDTFDYLIKAIKKELIDIN